jgi:SHS2 domain-containing protein
MSWWILPTTADIGIRAFSNNSLDAIKEVTFGLQSIQISSEVGGDISSLIRHTGQWSVPLIDEDLERGMVLWLEEVLYRGMTEDKWLVDVSFMISQSSLDAQVSWVDSNHVVREIEIKAVTMHELILREIKVNEIMPGLDGHIPVFEGPGWVAQVVLDL